MKKTIILSLLIPLYLFLYTSTVSASSLGLSISPSIVEANIRPGKTITQAFVLQNQSDNDQTFIAKVIPFTPGDSDGNPVLKPNLRPDWLKYFSISNSDIKLDEPFSLGANQSTQIILTISIPSKSAYTDLYATLLVSSVAKTTQGVNTSFGTTIGSNLIITINPQSHPPALLKITDFYPHKESYLFHYADYYIADNLSPIFFTAIAKNLGKYFTKTSGSVQVDRGKNNVSTQTLLANNILANSERNIEGSPSGELSFQPNPTSIGLYQVSLNLRSENSTSHAELTLLLLPIKAGIAFIIISIILVMILKSRKKK